MFELEYDPLRYTRHPKYPHTYKFYNRECKQCHEQDFCISEPKGQHHGGIYCALCHKFWGWISGNELAEIK